MEAQDWVSVVSGVAGTVGVCLAFFEFFRSRKNEETHRERLALLGERVGGAQAAAQAAADSADLIVQRSKDDNATLAELGNLARVARGNLVVLVDRLDEESNRLGQWSVGSTMDSPGPRELGS